MTGPAPLSGIGRPLQRQRQRSRSPLERLPGTRSTAAAAAAKEPAVAAPWQLLHHRNAAAEPPWAPYPSAAERVVSEASHLAALARLREWPEYGRTPLVRHQRLAELCGVAAVHLKDESRRAGVGSFKVLGGALVVEDLVREGSGRITVATASAGNHGLGVAWGAQRAGAEAVVYLHGGVSEKMAERMRALGAKVRRVEGSYEDSIACCIGESRTHGWHVVQDVSWPGYEDIPARISAGYSVCAGEILDQLEGEDVTHVLVNAGVGGFASAVFALFTAHLRRAGRPRPRLITVEPTEADVCLRSLRAGAMVPRPPSEAGTIQTGLDCKEVSPLAWLALHPTTTDSLAVPDEAIGPAMRFLAASQPPIAAGESGVAGVAALLAAGAQPELRSALGLDGDSRVVAIVCEAPPDPESYLAVVGRTPEQVLRG